MPSASEAREPDVLRDCSNRLLDGDRDDARLGGEEFSHRRDPLLNLWIETSKLVCCQEMQRVHRRQLPQHLGSTRVVERPSQHFVSVSEQSEHLEVPLVVTPRGVRRNAINFIENSLAVSLKRWLPELAENFPV